jgi:hypothetical protein
VSVTLGIDLASQPRDTAICLVAWSAGGAEVTALHRGRDARQRPLDDERLVAAMSGEDGAPRPAKIAIDAPLGWPVDFVRGVADPAKWPVEIGAKRDRVERRATDVWVHEQTGKRPLSVTADWVAYPAMRGAGILAHWMAETGETIDRSGVRGRVCEAYPDPAIRCFDLWPPAPITPRQSYKGDARDVRTAILDALATRAPWLALSDDHRERCIESDDCLDALLCALVARAAKKGATTKPPGKLADEARVEGWIHLPRPGALGALV